MNCATHVLAQQRSDGRAILNSHANVRCRGMKTAATLTIFTMTMLLSNSHAVPPASSENPASSRGWKQLAPLPDPVGWGGMFAGVLDGRLVAGGGSQFPDKPVWLQGTKTYNDRIYVLAEPDGPWEFAGTRLPEKSGHFAVAATADAIYLVGGITDAGCRPTCLVVRAEGAALVVEALPDLPKPLGYAVAAVAAGKLIVTGGQHALTDKQASAETWSLDLGARDAAWTREADLPGPGVFVPCAASNGISVFLFGGMAFNRDGKLAPAKEAYGFDVTRRAWERLPDLPEPRVGAASPAAQLPDGSFLLVGGYAEVFPGAIREHPGFSTQTLVYDPRQRLWSHGPMLPRALIGNRDATTDVGPTPMVAAPCAVWRDLAVVVSGEIRGATRTPTVVAWPLHETFAR